MNIIEFFRSSVFEAYWYSALVAYLLGSLSFAVIFSWLFEKKDVRNFGSGNAGATNVFRSVGFWPGLLTFVLDFAKGAAAMALSTVIFDVVCGTEAYVAERSICFCIAGLFALLGHLYPVYFGFRGGKGVMTMAGIMVILSPLRLLCTLAVFIIAFAFTRTVSIGSCACALAYPVITFLELFFRFHKQQPDVYDTKYLIVQTAMAVVFGAIILLKHGSNIKRILNGTEPKMTIRKSADK